jgi:PPOX class probable F420-dependent enzyme
VTGGVDEQGRVVISSYPQRAKCVNIRRNPTASAVILSDEFNGAYVQVDGDAEVIGLPEAVELLVDYFRVIAGEHPDWEEYRRAMVDQGKCLIRITPRRWGPVATGGFPPT